MAEAPSELAAEIAKLEQKHAENPEGRFFVPLANAFRKAGDPERAETLLREGLKLHPDYLSAHIVLGRCLADRGATDEATEEFRRVIEVDSQNLIALRTLGELAAAGGRAEEADRWYRELLAVDPMNEDAHAYLEGVHSEWADEASEAAAPADVMPDTGPREEPTVPAESSSGWEMGEGDESPDGSPPPDQVDIDSAIAQIEGSENVAEPASAVLDGEWADEGEPELVADTSAAAVSELPAEQETFAADTGPAQYDEPAGSSVEDTEVVTETLAELYARQGFFDRAADIYRKLIPRRGDDAALQARLEEVEQRMAGAAAEDSFAASFAHGFAGAPAPVPESATAAEEVGAFELPAADTVGSEAEGDYAADFTEVAGPAASAPSWEVSESDETLAPSTTPSIGDYLRGLLAWKPSAGYAVGGPAAVVEDLPSTDPDARHPESGSDGFTGEGHRPGDAQEASGAAPSDEQAAEDTGFSFNAFFQEDSATDQVADVPTSQTPAAATPEDSAAHAEQDSGTGVNGAATEDEDLESFQAWLRSLKR